MNPLAGWANFYVIVGSAAGALIGLQFVVMTLVAQKVDKVVPEDAGAAFTTPTIVHFGAVLLLSGVLTAPWEGKGPFIVAWALIGLAGVAFCISTARHLRKQTIYPSRDGRLGFLSDPADGRVCDVSRLRIRDVSQCEFCAVRDRRCGADVAVCGHT